VPGWRDGWLAASDRTLAKPQLAAGRGVVALDSFVTVENEFAMVAGVDLNGRAPASIVAAAGAPNFCARAFVEGDQISVFIGVAILHDVVIDQDRTGGDAPGAFEFAEVFAPERLAFDGIGVHAGPAEKGDDDFAIGHAAGRGPAVHQMARFGRSLP